MTVCTGVGEMDVSIHDKICRWGVGGGGMYMCM